MDNGKMRSNPIGCAVLTMAPEAPELSLLANSEATTNWPSDLFQTLL
jgi:hypothetical protein